MAGTTEVLSDMIKQKKIILIDMDNTLVNWDAQFEKLMKNLYPDVQLVPLRDRIHWSIELNYPHEERDKISTLTQQPQFWLSMPPMEGGVEALKEMEKEGYSVYIVSSPDNIYTSQCALEKYKWIEKHMGRKWKDKLILTMDKTLIQGDVLIDDKPTAGIGVVSPTWQHVLFSHAYNEMHPQIKLRKWNEWKNVFQQIGIYKDSSNNSTKNSFSNEKIASEREVRRNNFCNGNNDQCIFIK